MSLIILHRRRILDAVGGGYEPPSVGVNTYIGGVASSIPDTNSLATKLGISESDISSFAIKGSDIEATINEDFSVPADCFLEDTDITYFRNTSGCVAVNDNAFTDCHNINHIHLHECLTVGHRAFLRVYVCKQIYLPTCHSFLGNYTIADIRDIAFLYAPMLSLMKTAGNDNNCTFLYGNKMYVHPDLSTINGGSPDGDLIEAANNGIEIIYGENQDLFTHPNNFSLSNIVEYPTAIQFVDNGSSANSIGYFEVHLNEVFYGNVEAGGSITGLDPETSYQITAVVVDEFNNRSESSVSVTAKTKAEFVYQNTVPSDIYSLRKKANFREESVRLARSSDNEETDVLLPETGFISLSSEVSDGGTLGDWVGNNDAIVKRVYNALRPDKDLVFTNADYKLITGGVLNTINGKPAISISSGEGLKAIGLNGGNTLINASVFVVYQNNTTINSNRAAGFGNYTVDGNAAGKIHWNPAGDNSLRFDGGAITSNSISAATGPKIRASFKKGDSYSDFINGVQNISPTILSGTSIVDDFYVGVHSPDLLFSEAVVFLEDNSADVTTIQSEQNSAFNNIY